MTVKNTLSVIRKKSAQQGDADAQYNLGVMYHNGDGVEKDYVTAYKWWTLAAEQGHEEAREARDIIIGISVYIGKT